MPGQKCIQRSLSARSPLDRDLPVSALQGTEEQHMPLLGALLGGSMQSHERPRSRLFLSL